MIITLVFGLLKTLNQGDVLIREDGKYPFIFKECFDGNPFSYCCIDPTDSIFIETDIRWLSATVRPATSNERQQFFNKLKEEGYWWDAESLALSKIQKRWRDNEDVNVTGYCIGLCGCISEVGPHISKTYRIYPHIFAAEKQAKSALDMARISQIMINDNRFGGVVTDEEWNGAMSYIVITKVKNKPFITSSHRYEYLAFHTQEQAKLFLQENEDLVKDYYMMD